MNQKGTLKLWIPFDEAGNILWEDLKKSTEGGINEGWGLQVSDTKKSKFPLDCQPGAAIQSVKSVAVMSLGRSAEESQDQLLKATRGKQVCITYMQDGVEKTVCYPARPRC